jgi:PAS domain S-box-containing protein
MDTQVCTDEAVGIALINVTGDDSGRIVGANRSLAFLLATTVEDLKGSVLCELIHTEDRIRAVDEFTRMIGQGRNSCAGEGRLLVKEGGVRWVRVQAGIMPSGGDARLMVLLHINQIAEPSAQAASPMQ